MTQEKANKIFESSLGVQIGSFYCTADDRVFIRYGEAVEHSDHFGLDINAIVEWFRDDEEKSFVQPLLRNLKDMKKTEKDSKELVQDGPMDFYCIAREDDMVPCETQCITCLNKEKEIEQFENDQTRE